MVIKKKIYNSILLNVPENPPETGGIIGCKNGIVSYVSFDEGIKGDRQCCYIPDTDKLNLIIKDWESHDIEFAGIFHVHFWKVDTLSNADYKYIQNIMDSMPEKVKKLYFPLVVLPEKKIISYVAHRENDDISLKKEKIYVCD